MSEKTAAKPVTPAKKETNDNKAPTPNKNKPPQDGNKHQEQNRNRGDRGGHGGAPRRGGGGGVGGGRGRFNNNRNYSQGGGDRNSNMGHKNQPPHDSESNVDLSSGPKEDPKFTGRCRLFIGNLTPDVTEEEFKGMFTKYGEISELFVNGAKGFGFIRMDYRNNAEAAKAALDGTQRKGRSLRVRFANHGAAIRIKNLSPFVSNELLNQSFSQFGDIERAIVCVDDRGRSSGEGIVEFARKPGASQAMKRINDGVFLMSSYPRPVFVEPLEQKDEEDGLPEKFLPRNEHCRKDREKEPRFAPPGSFEFRFAQRWKELDELEKQQHDRVKQEMEDARIKLEAEMEGAMYEFKAEQIRADLVRQQEELQRIEEMRGEQMRRRQEMDMRNDTFRRQEENRMVREEEDRRREMIMRGEGSGMRGGGRGPMDSHRSSQMDQGGMRGDGMRGDVMRGDGMRGEVMRGGEGMRGEGMRGEGIRGEGQRGRSGGPPPVPPPPAPPAAMGIENRQQSETSGSGFGGGSGGNIGGGMGSSQGSMQGQSQGIGGQGQGMQRQSRFDQQGGNYGNGNFGGRGGMGGQGGGMSGGNGGGGVMQGGNNMYGGGGMSGNMGGGRGGMNERRRQEAGGPREEYGEMKRMRRY